MASQQIRSRLFGLLTPLLKSDVLAAVRGSLEIAKDLHDHFAHIRAPGIYEVLEHDRTVELLDPEGKVAVVRRQQAVRFLQDYVTAITDYAWGDGEIFSEYSCSPGHPVDFYKEGSRHGVLISLREAKSRGDVLEFHIRRKILGGFTRREECWETEVYHRTKQLTLRIIFPRERKCQRATVSQRSTSKTVVLDQEHYRYLHNGRQELRWVLRRPRLHDRYTLRWQW